MIEGLDTSYYHYENLANLYRKIGEITMLDYNIDHYLDTTVRKTDVDRLGKIKMKFREFIVNNIESLEIPYKPDDKRIYPQDVWAGLHKSLVVNQLQEYKRTDTIKSLINSVIGGDDLGGITIDNIIDMWLESMTSTVNHIVGSALSNSKINEIFEDLVTQREVECSDYHNDTEEQLVDKGIELPVHYHTVQSIDVTDDNREQFDEFVDLVLRNFDSKTYGELPEEYSEARASDIKAMISELKEKIGDNTDLASFLHETSDTDNSGDYA